MTPKPTIGRVIGGEKSRKREIARTDRRKFARSGKIYSVAVFDARQSPDLRVVRS
ncbi:MAG: hypothetical protein ACERJ2_16905 [Filomicrobium sp.]